MERCRTPSTGPQTYNGQLMTGKRMMVMVRRKKLLESVCGFYIPQFFKVFSIHKEGFMKSLRVFIYSAPLQTFAFTTAPGAFWLRRTESCLFGKCLECWLEPCQKYTEACSGSQSPLKKSNLAPHFVKVTSMFHSKEEKGDWNLLSLH